MLQTLKTDQYAVTMDYQNKKYSGKIGGKHEPTGSAFLCARLTNGNNAALVQTMFFGNSKLTVMNVVFSGTTSEVKGFLNLSENSCYQVNLIEMS